MIKAVDLFCGIGGLTAGLIRAGIDVRAGFDIDESCKYGYEESNQVEYYAKDIAQVKPAKIRKLLGNGTTMIAGCAPCQPFSNHLNRRHSTRSEHKKWDALAYFGNLVKEVKPSIVTMENVPQLRLHQSFTAFEKILYLLYSKVSINVIDCRKLGMAQNRKRLVVLASDFQDIDLGNLYDFAGPKQTVFDVIGALEPIKHGHSSLADPLHRASALSNRNLERMKCSKPGGTWMDWPEALRLECHRKAQGSGYTSVYGRMRWNGSSPTITTNFFTFGTGRFGHPEQDRALSLREGALLQGFPKQYVFSSPDQKFNVKQAATHIGNAVPVTLAEAIGKLIVNATK